MTDRFVRLAPVALLLVYVVVGLATLTRFPLVSGDEGWYVASGWSFVRDGNFALPQLLDVAGLDTDNVAYGRTYLAAMAAAFAALDPTPYAARLVSFISGLVVLVAVYGVGRELWSPRVGVTAAVLLAIAPVFVDQTHDARPEIMQLAFSFVAFWLMLIGERRSAALVLVIAGLIASLAVDIHVNSLVVPAALIAVLFVRRAGRRVLAWFFVGVVIGGLWWLAIHILPDVDRYVAQVGTFSHPLPLTQIVSEPVLVVGMEIARYFRVDLGSWALLVVGLVASGYLLYRHRDLGVLSVLTYAAVTLLFMLLLVGNPQPFYAVLLWPTLALVVGRFLDVVDRRVAIATAAVIIGVSLISVGHMAWRDRDADYDAYIAQVRASIPAGATTVSLPSTWFGFVDQPFISMNYFERMGPFGEQVRRHDVEYIVVDELASDLLVDHLGDVPADEFHAFLAEHAEVVAEVIDPYYGRLQTSAEAHGGEPPFTTKIYRVLPEPT